LRCGGRFANCCILGSGAALPELSLLHGAIVVAKVDAQLAGILVPNGALRELQPVARPNPERHLEVGAYVAALDQPVRGAQHYLRRLQPPQRQEIAGLHEVIVGEHAGLVGRGQLLVVALELRLQIVELVLQIPFHVPCKVGEAPLRPLTQRPMRVGAE